MHEQSHNEQSTPQNDVHDSNLMPISNQTPRPQLLTQNSLMIVTPQNALHLQRTFGNRLVTQMIQRQQQPKSDIQREFVNGVAFLMNTDRHDGTLITMSVYMNRYNRYLDKDEKKPKDYQEAARILRLLDREIFKYFDHHNAKVNSIEATPHYNHVEAVRKQAAREHEDFVQDCQNNDEIPFDPKDMEEHEWLPLIDLWNSIRQGMGKIRVSGNPDYQKRVYSWLVKLLETPTGRKLLDKLNIGDPSELMTNIYIGEEKSELPDGVEEGAKQKGRDIDGGEFSEAQPLGQIGEIVGPEEPTGDEDQNDFPYINDAGEFREAVLAGAKGFILNRKKYSFNTDQTKHVGAFVTANEGESENESAEHNQILTPGWVTLGHELGHTVHFRGGANSLQNPQIMQDMTGKSRGELDHVWQNSDELLTIQGWENALRSDVGLTERASHIPYTAGKRVERYWSIYGPFKQKYADPSYAVLFVDIGDFLKALKDNFNLKDPDAGFNNNVTYQKLQEDGKALEQKYSPQDLRAKKQEIIQTEYEKLATTYYKKLGSYNRKLLKNRQTKARWMEISEKFEKIKFTWRSNYKSLLAEENDIPAEVQSEFDKFCSDIRNLLSRLNRFNR